MSFEIGVLLALLSLVLWGFSDLVTKISLDRDSKWKVLFLGQLFGGLIILIAAALLGELNRLFSGLLIWLLALGVINFVGMYTYYEAMRVKGIALTTSIAYSWSLIAIALGLIFYNESITLLQIVGILFILLGIFAITLKQGEKLVFDKTFFFAVASMFVWGVFFFLVKQPILLFGPVIVAMTVKIVTSLTSIPVLLHKKISVLETKQKVLLGILAVGLLDSTGLLAYNLAVTNAPVSIVAPISSATPVLSVLLGVLVLKEKLLTQQKLGILTTIAGIILVAL